MGYRSKHNVGVTDPSAITSSMFHMASISSTTSNGLFTYNPASSNAPTFPTSKRRPSKKIDNVSVLSLVEGMKDSSPPRVRCSSSDSLNDTPCKATIEMQYRAWMAKHPSALQNFDRIFENAKGKPVIVFLDYDGTLSPIVEDPECAFMSDEMRLAVEEIATLFPTAIITGRSREKVYEFVQLPELYYAGSHGMDIMGPVVSRNGFKVQGTKVLDKEGNEAALFQPASEFTIIMNEIFKLLEDKASKVPGAKVEHNKFCVSVHFRCVKEENWVPLAEQVQHVLLSYPNICLTQGRKVLEVRPLISWNKGKALDYLLRTLGYGGRNDVFPIYIGDDQTDEDAFEAVVRKKYGLAIIVSSVVKETNATWSLTDPSEVLQFLQNVVKWKLKCCSSSGSSNGGGNQNL